MPFKVLTVILLILLCAETAFILPYRRSGSRFLPVSGYQGFLALDTRDGRLCSTMPGNQAPSVYKEEANKETNENLKVDLSTLAAVPTCWSIR